MNRMTWPSCLARSLSTAFSRSSNSPRNFAPAISAPMSSASMRLLAQALGHFAVDDALRQALDDRGLADAGLADQHRIVLGAPLQHLDRAADLLVAADHRVELALLGALGQVDGVLLERLALLLGVRVVDLLAAAHFVDRLLERALARRRRLAAAWPSVALVVERGEHEQLAGDELVAALLRELVGEVQQRGQVVARRACRRRCPRPSAGGRAPRPGASAAAFDVDAGLVEQRPHAAALLVEQRHASGGPAR